MSKVEASLDAVAAGASELYGKDFLLTWDKSGEDLIRLLELASALKGVHGSNRSLRCFDSGLAVSIFRDNSTRTRFSFASAANLLGLAVQDLDEGKSQIAHGETVRETANMVSFLAEVIGIRDDMYLGAGHTYMKEVGEALDDGFANGVLPCRPAIVNLQCDVDHPTQAMADLAWLNETYGSLEALKGKTLAMTWAYSPSYGKPLSVPQGIIGLMTRFGMNVRLAYPEGYNLIPEVEALAAKQGAAHGGSFSVTHSMDEAFDQADIVYPKSWAPFEVMGRRTELLKLGDQTGLKELEQHALARNANHRDWTCTEDRMAKTRNGDALYMHCLPADITGVSCREGEVDGSVFERYRIRTYREAGWKPYIIAAMMLAARFKNPAEVVRARIREGVLRQR
ncbi:MAG TPA: knotted carbamoyltransferase YgeW [Kiritimatiellia bacterium]|nr:knotted carbamoyltransferase YgeW [Kiritimatiellia bacterium]